MGGRSIWRPAAVKTISTSRRCCSGASVIEALGPLGIDLHYALDYDFYLRAALHFGMRYVPFLVATYRMHEVSKTTTGGSAFAAELAAAAERCLDDPPLPAGSPPAPRDPGRLAAADRVE